MTSQESDTFPWNQLDHEPYESWKKMISHILSFPGSFFLISLLASHHTPIKSDSKIINLHIFTEKFITFISISHKCRIQRCISELPEITVQIRTNTFEKGQWSHLFDRKIHLVTLKLHFSWGDVEHWLSWPNIKVKQKRYKI